MSRIDAAIASTAAPAQNNNITGVIWAPLGNPLNCKNPVTTPRSDAPTMSAKKVRRRSSDNNAAIATAGTISNHQATLAASRKYKVPETTVALPAIVIGISHFWTVPLSSMVAGVIGLIQ